MLDSLTDDAIERKASGDYLALRHVLKAGPQASPIDFGPQDFDQAAIARRPVSTIKLLILSHG